MNIISGIFNVILALVLKIVALILLPFDYLISSLLPSLSDGLTAIGNFLAILTQGLGWAISLSGIPSFVIALVATAYIFRLTIPFNLWMVKLALNWYRALKP